MDNAWMKRETWEWVDRPSNEIVYPEGGNVSSEKGRRREGEGEGGGGGRWSVSLSLSLNGEKKREGWQIPSISFSYSSFFLLLPSSVFYGDYEVKESVRTEWGWRNSEEMEEGEKWEREDGGQLIGWRIQSKARGVVKESDSSTSQKWLSFNWQSCCNSLHSSPPSSRIAQ